ncbi:TIGR02206 family membrane protein [Prauserella oleivorans]|uniref:TIGR02206 family membrane protein n=1 Tax=Prauserella oleivorans TaxID=1478153 RepID=A0ABW5WAH8_9PSEU
MELTAQEFSSYGPSHWAVLVVFVLGLVLLIRAGRAWRGTEAQTRFSRVFAVLLLIGHVAARFYSVALGIEEPIDAVPLHVSDLVGFVAAYALWTHRRWAFAVTYYWCLSLTTQALISPAFVGPDFPHYKFMAFWGLHLLAVWAAIYLTWGVGLHPTWREYRICVTITVSWAVVAFVFNSIAGTNFGFLNRKPANPSVLELLGPWPWYLLPEAVLILGVWALITWPWTRHDRAGTRRRRRPLTPPSGHGA